MEIISNNVSKVYKIKKGLFKTYEVNVVSGLNYSIKQGEIIGLLGAEASGKSTFIKLLSGNVLPTAGEVFVDGEVDYKKLKNKCEIINDFSKCNLNEGETVYNNFVHFGAKNKLDELTVEKNISIYRDIFELDDSINKNVSELNNLELVKVNLTLAMLKGVSTLFFDSSLSDLAPVEKNVVLKLLKRLNKENKTTIVVGSSKVDDIEKICKRVTVINKGSIVRDGAFEELKTDLCSKKEIKITFNKTYSLPKGDFEIIEHDDYFLKIKVDFAKCDFANLITQFDVNTIVDIGISNTAIF